VRHVIKSLGAAEIVKIFALLFERRLARRRITKCESLVSGSILLDPPPQFLRQVRIGTTNIEDTKSITIHVAQLIIARGRQRHNFGDLADIQAVDRMVPGRLIYLHSSLVSIALANPWLLFALSSWEYSK
jgi:hypothetical protein